jgi:hypothetical protein
MTANFTGSDNFIPTFETHLSAIASADYATASAHPEANVVSEDHFNAMKAHLMHLNDGVTPIHSFMGEKRTYV